MGVSVNRGSTVLKNYMYVYTAYHISSSSTRGYYKFQTSDGEDTI